MGRYSVTGVAVQIFLSTKTRQHILSLFFPVLSRQHRCTMLPQPKFFRKYFPIIAIVVFLACVLAPVQAEETTQDPEKLPPDLAFQGEYAGTLDYRGGVHPFGLQVIAYGHGVYRAELYDGGLPGTPGVGRDAFREGAMGITRPNGPFFTTPDWAIALHDGLATFHNSEPRVFGELKKIERKSPTLGLKAPAGASVLFDGTGVDQFQPGAKMTAEKLLTQGAMSLEKFGDCTVHVEFRLPLMLEALGQDRGNSGVILQGRYEVQVVDSFGLEGRHNECGGIYSIHAPTVNMCFPPMVWQTYDIDFTAARYKNGVKVTDPKITVRQNGVLIQDGTSLPHTTPAAPFPEADAPGPLYLQDHHSEVRYRNVWVLPNGH